MKDFYGREIQIGDKCVFYCHYVNGFVNAEILGENNGGDKIDVYTQYFDEKSLSPKRIIDITAIEREVREQQFINSVKALDIKPNDRIIASLNPNQMPMEEAENIFNQMKKIFPDNKVLFVVGLDVSIE
jgi:hypothetical protein